MNNKVISLNDYIWLRKVNRAYQECGENIYISPNKMYCALKITSPKSKRMTSSEEANFYKMAIILVDGYDIG